MCEPHHQFCIYILLYIIDLLCVIIYKSHTNVLLYAFSKEVNVQKHSGLYKVVNSKCIGYKVIIRCISLHTYINTYRHKCYT